MSVPTTMLEHLAAARTRGVGFDLAWVIARRAALDGHPDAVAWHEALQSTRDAWEAAWNGEAASRPERALYVVVDDPDREPLPPEPAPGERRCAWCGGPIAATKRRQARFCSREHQRASHGRGVPEAA